MTTPTSESYSKYSQFLLFLLFGIPILLINFFCDCILFFSHAYNKNITRRLEKESTVELQAETYNLLKRAIKKRLDKRKTRESASTFIKDIRDQMQVMDILQRFLLYAEFNPSEL